MPKLNLRVVTDRSESARINAFIYQVAETSCSPAYSPKQIQLLNKHVFGIHEPKDADHVVEDRTFYVLENEEGNIIATCGWSIRDFKGNLLNPENQPARIRTFFVHPDYQKFGLASLLLMICENAALEAQFKCAELFATLNGLDFYLKRNYIEKERRGYGISAEPLEGEILEFILMQKDTLVSNSFSEILARLLSKDISITLADGILKAREHFKTIIYSPAGIAALSVKSGYFDSIGTKETEQSAPEATAQHALTNFRND